jgi:hypothetical protein
MHALDRHWPAEGDILAGQHLAAASGTQRTAEQEALRPVGLIMAQRQRHPEGVAQLRVVHVDRAVHRLVGRGIRHADILGVPPVGAMPARLGVALLYV